MDKDTFQQEVYNVVAAIPPGRVVTYGQIAYLVGRPQCSRMVGHAMHDVPDGMCPPQFTAIIPILSPKSSFRRSKAGISLTHGPHQVAQKLMITGFPCSSDSVMLVPSISSPVKSGA